MGYLLRYQSEFTELAKSRFLDCESCNMTQGALIRNVADCQALYMQAKQTRSDILYMTTLDTGRCSQYVLYTTYCIARILRALRFGCLAPLNCFLGGPGWQTRATRMAQVMPPKKPSLGGGGGLVPKQGPWVRLKGYRYRCRCRYRYRYGYRFRYGCCFPGTFGAPSKWIWGSFWVDLRQV